MTEQEARKIAAKEIDGPVGKLLTEDADAFVFEFETDSYFDIDTMTVRKGAVRTGGVSVFKTGANAGNAVVLPE